jgi:hypothetical protein
MFHLEVQWSSNSYVINTKIVKMDPAKTDTEDKSVLTGTEWGCGITVECLRETAKNV